MQHVTLVGISAGLESTGILSRIFLLCIQCFTMKHDLSQLRQGQKKGNENEIKTQSLIQNRFHLQWFACMYLTDAFLKVVVAQWLRNWANNHKVAKK